MRKLRYFVLVLLLFTININVKASTKTFDRNEKDNLGVNKKWHITEKNKSNVLATPLVDSSEKIYDFSDVLTEEEEIKLKEKIDKFISKSNIDVVIVTTNLPYVSDDTNETYASDFYDYNDFGINFDRYSGVLLLRNTYEQDPYYNMYMFGDAQLYYYGQRTENILDDIYNDVHLGNYLSGFELFINEINNYYDDKIPDYMKDYYVDDNGYLKKEYIYHYPLKEIVIISLIITSIIMIILLKKNKMVKKAYEAREYLDGNSISYSIKKDQFLSSHTTHHRINTNSGSSGFSSGSSFSSHSGSSGGGHSSGGGRHG